MIVAAAFAAAAVVYARRTVAQSRVTHDADAERRLEQVRAIEQEAKSVLLAAKEEAARRRDEAEAEVRERNLDDGHRWLDRRWPELRRRSRR